MALQEKEAKYEYSIENDDYHMYNEGVEKPEKLSCR